MSLLIAARLQFSFLSIRCSLLLHLHRVMSLGAPNALIQKYRWHIFIMDAGRYSYKCNQILSTAPLSAHVLKTNIFKFKIKESDEKNGRSPRPWFSCSWIPRNHKKSLEWDYPSREDWLLKNISVSKY